jgi:hypothetical protein
MWARYQQPVAGVGIGVDGATSNAGRDLRSVERRPVGISLADPDVDRNPGWLRALEGEYGQRAVRLACIDAGRVVGILPLMHTRGLPFNREGAVSGRRLSSLPRTPIARLGAGATAALVRKKPCDARRQATAPGSSSKCAHPVLDDVAEVLVGRPWRNTYVLELPPAPGHVRFGTSRNHAAINRAVTNARSAGVTVRHGGSLEDVRA